MCGMQSSKRAVKHHLQKNQRRRHHRADSIFDWQGSLYNNPPPTPSNLQITTSTENSERNHRIISRSLYSRSSSKWVSMPSAPGTEQMSLAFRKVLHLLTRQQWPPSSFCIGEGGDTEQFLHHSLKLTSSSVFLLKTNPGGATHTHTIQYMLVCKARKPKGGRGGGEMVNTVSSYLDSSICGGARPESIPVRKSWDQYVL